MSAQSEGLVLSKKKQILSVINTPTFKQQLAAALMARVPEDYVVRSAIAMINNSPKIQECTPVSIAASILLLAQAGLAPEPWKGHGYLIPRGGKCTALIGYRGYVSLAYRSPEVVKAGAYPVYNGDVFDLDLGAGTMPIHRPWVKPEEGRTARGFLIGAYAFVKLKNGECLVEWMTKDEIDAVRSRSQAASSGPWVTDYSEMARKTPFRRLFKWVPDPDLQRIAAMDEASDMGVIESTIDEHGEIITVLHEDSEPEPQGDQPKFATRTEAVKAMVNKQTGGGITTAAEMPQKQPESAPEAQGTQEPTPEPADAPQGDSEPTTAPVEPKPSGAGATKDSVTASAMTMTHVQVKKTNVKGSKYLYCEFSYVRDGKPKKLIAVNWHHSLFPILEEGLDKKFDLSIHEENMKFVIDDVLSVNGAEYVGGVLRAQPEQVNDGGF